MQHIDAPESLPFGNVPRIGDWHNPPHRSHLCAGCGHIWRPADVATNGVAAIKTKGKNDSPVADRERRAVPAGFKAELLQSIDEPDDELLEEFQRAFVQQLHRRRNKPHLESAEKAGARAMFKLAISRAAAPADAPAEPEPERCAFCGAAHQYLRSKE